MFTTTPANYGSLYESQIFKFTSTYIEDHTYEIKEVNSGDVLGVKKFYQTDSASLNVAPIIRPFALPKPISSSSAFLDPTNFGSIRVSLSRSGSVESDVVESEQRVFSLSRSEESEVGVVSTLNSTRTISMGESELLLLRCEPYATVGVTVTQFAYDWSSEDPTQIDPASFSYFVYEDDGSGFALFSTAAEKLGEMVGSDDDIERYLVAFYDMELVDDDPIEPVYRKQLIETVTYYVIDPPKNPMRLAWVSSRGSVEHYTMPYVVSQMVQRSGGSIYTLRSALENYQMREVLAEVVTSEAIWIVADGEYVEVEIVGDEVEISPEKDLATVEFKILYRD